MLTKQRQEMILKLLEEKGSITVTEIKDLLDTSESTVRRDIIALDREGKLTKVFGGAVLSAPKVTSQEYTVDQKKDLNQEEKKKIGRYAASLIEPGDFVYLDAGTTTACMIDYLEKEDVTFVTNAVVHAQRLVTRGFKVFLVGGELKESTEAVIGAQAAHSLKKYHFTKGFFGANGVTRQSGCTTPDVNEAMVKQIAREQCKVSYVLCDSSKFDNTSSVTFAPFHAVVLITDKEIAGYEGCGNIVTVE